MLKQPYHHGDLKNALIQAGIEILSTEGLEALTLRKVAGKAGVSHSAPYAHFVDKQALIAAISTEGYRRLYERISTALSDYAPDARTMLLETAWAYIQFALDDPACFKLMFSGILEQENEYPEFVEMSHKNFEGVVRLVEHCQAAGVLRPGAADVLAVSVWSLVHGFAALLLERQISHNILQRGSLKELLWETIQPITLEKTD